MKTYRTPEMELKTIQEQDILCLSLGGPDETPKIDLLSDLTA